MPAEEAVAFCTVSDLAAASLTLALASTAAEAAADAAAFAFAIIPSLLGKAREILYNMRCI